MIQQCHPLRRCLRYAHRHRLWARAASVPTPLCRACHSVHAGGCDQGVSWMVLALASGRTAPTPRRLRLGSLRNGAECGGGTVAVEPRQRWQLLCGRIGPRLTQAALCACAGFACLRACALRLRLQRPCRGRKLPPANCRLTSLGHKTIHGTNMLNVRRLMPQSTRRC